MAASTTSLSKHDTKRLARFLYSLRVQESKLDMQAYDMDKTLQREWFAKADTQVAAIEAETGQPVVLEG